MHSLYASIGPSASISHNTQGTTNSNSFTQLTNQHTRDIPRTFNNNRSKKRAKGKLVLLNRLLSENKHTRTLSATAKLKGDTRDRNLNKTHYSIL